MHYEEFAADTHFKHVQRCSVHTLMSEMLHACVRYYQGDGMSIPVVPAIPCVAVYVAESASPHTDTNKNDTTNIVTPAVCRRCKRTIRSVSLRGALARSALQPAAFTAARGAGEAAEGANEARFRPLRTCIRRRQ